MIHYHFEDITFPFNTRRKTSAWLKKVIDNEGYSLQALNYIFCSDEYLHQVNVEYLNHDTFTDIITFDNSDEGHLIEGDIFVSIDRIKENAQTLGNDFENEFKRVLVHGVLHLCGHSDKSADDKQKMRNLESFYLSIFSL